MAIIDYMERLNRLYRLVRMENTGSPKELSRKLRLSPRTVSNYLAELRSMGADIKFSRTRNSYRLENAFTLIMGMEAGVNTEITLKKGDPYSIKQLKNKKQALQGKKEQ